MMWKQIADDHTALLQHRTPTPTRTNPWEVGMKPPACWGARVRTYMYLEDVSIDVVLTTAMMRGAVYYRTRVRAAW